jgi:hypothetical protein
MRGSWACCYGLRGPLAKAKRNAFSQRLSRAGPAAKEGFPPWFSLSQAYEVWWLEIFRFFANLHDAKVRPTGDHVGADCQISARGEVT